MKGRTLGHRAPLLWLLVPFLAGLTGGDASGSFRAAAWLLAGALPAAGWAVAAAWRDRRSWAPAIIASMVLAGAASYTLHRQSPPDGAGWPAREARLTLRVDRLFNPAPQSRSASGTATVTSAESHLRALQGQEIYFSLPPNRKVAARAPARPSAGGARRIAHPDHSPTGKPSAPALERSEIIAVIGLLTPLKRHAPAGTLDHNLEEMGFHFRLTLGHLIRAVQPAAPYRQFCSRTAERMNGFLGRGLERQPALAAVYRAMMLGRKHDLGVNQASLFLRSGTMHLFAINGVHIGVVALSLHALLALARCPRTAAAALVLALLWLDVDTTGASPSAVRAFLMIAALEAGRMLGRPANPIASLTTAALITVWLTPMEIFTASFQMSYGVMAALCTLGFPFSAWLHERFPPYRYLPEVARNRVQRFRARLQNHLLASTGVGSAAALIGGVTGVAFFNLLAPVGLVANLVLIPLASLVIAAGVASLVGGFAGVAAASCLFNSAAGVLLRLITQVVRLAVKIPGASFSAHYRAPWIGPVALAAVLIACLAGYAADWRRARGGFWPPFVIVAIVLLLGVAYRP
jgi:competence protein ComEC